MTAASDGQVIDHGMARAIPGRTKETRSLKRFLPTRRAALLWFGIILGVAAIFYGFNWWNVGRFIEVTDDAYVGGNVTPIAPHVAGFVDEILVSDNQFVRAGQPIIRLNPDDYQAALEHAQAIVAERQATLGNLQAQLTMQGSVIEQAQQNLAAKKAAAVFASQEAARYQSLANTAAGSRQDAERTMANIQTAQAEVASANAALAASRQQLAVLATQITGAKATITQAEADLQTARLNLGYTVITSPIDGYVGDRYAQVGTYVETGTNLLSISPSQGLWIDANFKEDQIADMKPGDPVTVVADVLPGQAIHGHVLSVAPATGAIFSVIPPQNATGNFTKIVQRVPIRIALDGDAAVLGLLRPGLSATVSVNTKHHTQTSSR